MLRLHRYACLYVPEVTIKQLKEKLREYEEKLETTAEVSAREIENFFLSFMLSWVQGKMKVVVFPSLFLSSLSFFLFFFLSV